MIKLKPCPFCGGDSAFIENSEIDKSGAFFYVECSACRGCSAWAQGEEKAANVWNTRQPAINWQPIGELPQRKVQILLARNDNEKCSFGIHYLSLLDGEIEYLTQNYTHFALLTSPEASL